MAVSIVQMMCQSKVFLFHIFPYLVCNFTDNIEEVYSEPFQISKMQLFARTVNRF